MAPGHPARKTWPPTPATWRCCGRASPSQPTLPTGLAPQIFIDFFYTASGRYTYPYSIIKFNMCTGYLQKFKKIGNIEIQPLENH